MTAEDIHELEDRFRDFEVTTNAQIEGLRLELEILRHLIMKLHPEDRQSFSQADQKLRKTFIPAKRAA